MPENTRELAWPLIIFSLIILIYALGSVSLELSPDNVVQTLHSYSSLMIVMSLATATSVIVYHFVKYMGVLRHSSLELGEKWIKDPRTGFLIGAVQLRGQLVLDLESRDSLLKIAALQERVENLFESLRNAKIKFCYLLAPASSLLDKSSLYTVLFLVYARSPDTLAQALNHIASACSATFPELEIKVLKGTELAELSKSLVLPSEPLSLSGKLSVEPGVLYPLVSGCISGVLKSTYKGVRTSLTATLPRPEDGIFLGKVIGDGHELADLYLAIKDLRQHVAIFGTTGSGKTTTAATIALRLVEKGVGVLIVDWHSEYCRLAQKVDGVVILPGTGSRPYSINPLALQDATHLMEHIDFITDMLAEIFELSHPQAFMLREALKRVYLRTIGVKATPTLSDLCEEIERIPIKSGWDHETKMALLRRLKLMTEGQLGRAFCGSKLVSIEDLMNNRLTVIGLGHFRNIYAKKLVTYTILKMLYDYHVRKGDFSESLKHVILLEEARNILPREHGGSRLYGIAERVLSELRKYGEGVIIVTQSPSTVSEDVLRNTSTRIIHALKNSDDIRTIARSLRLPEGQADLIARLKIGEALVDSPSLEGPVLIRVCPHELLPLSTSPRRETKALVQRDEEMEIELD